MLAITQILSWRLLKRFKCADDKIMNSCKEQKTKKSSACVMWCVHVAALMSWNSIRTCREVQPSIPQTHWSDNPPSAIVRRLALSWRRVFVLAFHFCSGFVKATRSLKKLQALGPRRAFFHGEINRQASDLIQTYRHVDLAHRNSTLLAAVWRR